MRSRGAESYRDRAISQPSESACWRSTGQLSAPRWVLCRLLPCFTLTVPSSGGHRHWSRPNTAEWIPDIGPSPLSTLHGNSATVKLGHSASVASSIRSASIPAVIVRLLLCCQNPDESKGFGRAFTTLACCLSESRYRRREDLLLVFEQIADAVGDAFVVGGGVGETRSRSWLVGAETPN